MRMFSQSTFSIYFLLMIFSLAGADLFDKTIKWVPVSQSEAVLLRLDPVGIEGGTHFFLCRVHHEGRYMAGKLRFNNGVIECLVGYSGKGYRSGEFQVLLNPRGTTSWVPFVNGIPNSSIIASKEGDEKTYVCRVRHGNYVISGTLTNEGVCKVELYNKEISVSVKLDIEILAINMYGERFGVTQAL